eukprot:scaffold32223_cov107-Isochrysis_galbana.AAC.5
MRAHGLGGAIFGTAARWAVDVTRPRRPYPAQKRAVPLRRTRRRNGRRHAPVGRYRGGPGSPRFGREHGGEGLVERRLERAWLGDEVEAGEVQDHGAAGAGAAADGEEKGGFPNPGWTC